MGVEDFAEQLVAVQPWLYLHARRLTRDLAEADDLVQDVNLLALRFRHRFDGRNLKGWLTTIAHNRLATQRRHQALIRFDNVDDHHELRAGSNVERQALARVDLAAANQLLLLKAAGFSELELAKLYRRAQSTIHSMLQRRRARLRRDVA